MLMLPACHSQSELELARRIEVQMGCSELHVFWTEGRSVAETASPPELVSGLIRGLTLVGVVLDAVYAVLSPRRPDSGPR